MSRTSSALIEQDNKRQGPRVSDPLGNRYRRRRSSNLALGKSVLRNETFRLGELFCGAGGLALGATSARVQTNQANYVISPVWANDFDKDACASYRQNICPSKPGHVICEDVHDLDLEKLTSIDALAFGFPCNDFSVVGERKGTNGNYGPLYSYGVRALRHFQPKWFLAENVGGLRHANEGKDLDTILSAMHRAGYNVYPHLYKFEDYGVPQARRRIIIVGLRKDLDLEFVVPAPVTSRPVTCRAALEIPAIPKNAANHELTVQSKTVVQRLRHIKPGENAFTANIPAKLRLNVAKTTISQIYKRLDPERPAYTITGSGGGGDARLPLERGSRPHQPRACPPPNLPGWVRVRRVKGKCAKTDRNGRATDRRPLHIRGRTQDLRRDRIRRRPDFVCSSA